MPDKLETGHLTPTGKSIHELLWDELDAVVDKLAGDWSQEPEEGDDEEWMEYGELRGQAQGLALAIAYIQNPYYVDVDSVRDTVVERQEHRAATGRSTPEVVENWQVDDTAYHKGRKVRITSITGGMAHLDAGASRMTFGAPIHELRRESGFVQD